MPSQFIHYGTYGRAAKKGAREFECASGILAEASRLPSATKHLKDPQPPQLLFGVLPITLDDHVQEIASSAVDLAGRGIRVDASVLVAGVVSYPVTVADADTEEYEKWSTAVLDWLRRTHKDRLLSVVAHMDEEYPHLHFFTLPILRNDQTLDWVNTHPGLEKKRFSWLHGESSVMQDRCYRVGMEQMQDNFHENVSKRFSHARYGPRRQRVGRAEAKLRQQLENERCAALANIEWRRKSLDAHEAFINRRVVQIKEEVMRHMEDFAIRMSPVELDMAKGRIRTLQSKLTDLAVSSPDAPVEEDTAADIPLTRLG